MSYSQIAESIIAKNAINKEIGEIKERLVNVDREISQKKSILNVGIMRYSLADLRFCENRMKELSNQKKQLTDQINRLNNTLSSINY